MRPLTIEEARLYGGSGPRRAARVSKPRSPRPIAPRQIGIIQAIWEEKTHKEIAFEFQTTEGTIRQEATRIRQRLGVRTTVGIALWWERNHGQFSKAS